MSLPMFPLPLSTNGPPAGYSWDERSASESNSSSCGESSRAILQYCHISKVAEPDTWLELKEYNWIPEWAKDHPEHEPRNGIMMCANHCRLFDAYEFFIRFLPDTRKFVFVNYSGLSSLEQYHGKAVALDINDPRAPFPSLFIIHEMRVRGHHPFQPVRPAMSENPLWQGWILSDGVFDNVSNSFIRNSLPRGDSSSSRAQPRLLSLQPMTSVGGAGTSGRHTLELNENVIADILAATRAMPSWRACELEGTGRQKKISKNALRLGLATTMVNLMGMGRKLDQIQTQLKRLTVVEKAPGALRSSTQSDSRAQLIAYNEASSCQVSGSP